MFSLIKKFKEYLEWRKRDKEEIFVASAEYKAVFVNTITKNDEAEVLLICSFYIDGNGVRYTRVNHPDSNYGRRASTELHSLVIDRHNWTNFGELPEYARRPDNKPKGKLYSITGGKTDE